MSNLETLIRERRLPDVFTLKSGKKVTSDADFSKRRGEIKKILEENEYGTLPPRPDHLRVEAAEHASPAFLAGKATYTVYKLTATFGEREFSFPVKAVVPKRDYPVPAFIHISFPSDDTKLYQPSEEIVDDGFAIFSFCYTDITSDDGNFSSGVAPLFSSSRRKLNSPGKIAMWAWAAMRVMDFVETLAYIDRESIAVIGHSRLGKTALLAGAFDERFKFVISNNSGCSGAALTRGKSGEGISRITNRYPYWFCPRYSKCAKNFDSEADFDQHFLLSLIAPRYLLIGSAEDDLWADPTSEFLAAKAASEAYSFLGRKGLITSDGLPKAKTVLDSGDICYHIRRGAHYLSREDWRVYMDFIKKKIGAE